jgi:hypothetical protein
MLNEFLIDDLFLGVIFLVDFWIGLAVIDLCGVKQDPETIRE